MDIKLTRKAISEIDPSHNQEWISLAYYDLENNWNPEAPPIDDVKEKIIEYKMNELRLKRNELLSETDWVSGDDVPQVLKDKWYPYRQELRDFPAIVDELDNPIWPIKPQ